MAGNSAIEWTDSTFNPWIGCTKVGPGCDHCYAEARMDTRLHRARWGASQARVRTQTWGDPERWNRQHEAFFAAHGRRQRVFCASVADVFDNEVPAEWRADLFRLILDTPYLDWLLLTKRIGNVSKMIDADQWEHLGNVWLGATVVNQEEADRDIPKLLATPARVRFLSMEPLLGPVSLRWLPAFPENAPATAQHPSGKTNHLDGLRRLDWVIVGGESGPGARPMRAAWVRSVRDQCMDAGVPFLFKQWGEFLPENADADDPQLPDVPDSRLFWSDGSRWDRFDGQRGGVELVARVGKKAAGRLLDGRTYDNFPKLMEAA